MKAGDLAAPYPTVRADADAAEAARLLTEHGRPGLIVVDEHDHPVAILPGSQVLRFLIPDYIQDDPALARVVDEAFIDEVCSALEQKTVKELLPKEKVPLPIVDPGDNLFEVAGVMAAAHSPLVAVVEGKDKTGPMIGAISLARLLGDLLPGRITDPS
ncbi:CBS domain-containing protein [Nocardioides sp. KR10-350]|uniref:CBS domain-containing protein n=1 Tax=Nocardioides cheoyonin TaxID=3156615 RepID=UPI0032B51192